MSGDHSRAEYGVVEFVLHDQSVRLVPTWQAMERINTYFGSISAAISQCAAMDYAGVHAVIVAALDVNTTGGKESIKEKIFLHGLPRAATEAVKFLRFLNNPTGKDESEGQEQNSGKF